MGHDPKSDLLWLAFRYVSDELAGDEVEAFERRLEVDQEAREAVAEAVELIGAVAVERPSILPMPVRPFRPRILLAAAAVAACLVLGVGLQVARQQGGAFGPTSHGDPDRDVALTWSGLHAGEDTVDADAPPLGDMMAWHGPDGGDAEAGGLSEGLPSWVFEAATLHQTPSVETKEN